MFDSDILRLFGDWQRIRAVVVDGLGIGSGSIGRMPVFEKSGRGFEEDCHVRQGGRIIMGYNGHSHGPLQNVHSVMHWF